MIILNIQIWAVPFGYRASKCAISLLSKREMEVVALLANGNSSPQTS
ncbi:hypothetical protein [Sphingobacterium detergens]